MCLLCTELSKEKIRSKKEFDEVFSRVDWAVDLDHWFEEIGPMYDALPGFFIEPEPACSCGAKYTSFPGHHLRYCKK